MDFMELERQGQPKEIESLGALLKVGVEQEVQKDHVIVALGRPRFAISSTNLASVVS